ncbi:hypothetical protein L9G15_11025 [Shewanella sp. A3A]|uniref:Uncharacterized protein n=1 Tax=Shewanella electrica TaxID=515560 RepID=A0ABT2FNH3_9GAMM|nr:hypothetical protein [Shewanella electrica]MCH1919966.1 hypothetical protein [Shewanella ferrihydritica]MCH1926094.1 hypothetical protein [Shewanella electrica]MCS4557537.1 hypothetical protein [Shewanella electrica]
MYNTAKKQVWYGELRTARGNVVVIHDNQLPEASPGRVFLYNTQRKAIVEYVEDIVKPNLYELSDDQVKAAESAFNGDWKSARSAFMAKQQSRINLANIKDTAPAGGRKAKPEPQIDDDDSDVDVTASGDDYDDDGGDDWDSDDYDE